MVLAVEDAAVIERRVLGLRSDQTFLARHLFVLHHVLRCQVDVTQVLVDLVYFLIQMILRYLTTLHHT